MNSKSEDKDIHILLVEDNPSDQLIARETLEELGFRGTLHCVEDGEQALDFVYRRGDHPDAPTPDLIILDLNIPKKNGKEVLEVIKTDPDMLLIPVVVLSTSTHPADIGRCYALHANCYLVKPVELEDFHRSLAALKAFWLDTVQRPKKASHFA